jgi:hypothetical protein
MKSLKNKIPKNLSLFEKLFLLVPFAIWFSYWPNFHFGKSEGANFIDRRLCGLEFFDHFLGF